MSDCREDKDRKKPRLQFDSFLSQTNYEHIGLE